LDDLTRLISFILATISLVLFIEESASEIFVLFNGESFIATELTAEELFLPLLGDGRTFCAEGFVTGEDKFFFLPVFSLFVVLTSLFNSTA
jgi:hypothetical protein